MILLTRSFILTFPMSYLAFLYFVDLALVLKAYENMYEILKFSEKFDNLDKMETTSSESKVKMEGSGKWLVTALALKTKARSTK